MGESAELARRLGLQLHTHLAETVEEDAYCLELYGCRPVEYLEQLGWLGEDVWCAHCVHLSADGHRRVRRRAASASRTARPRTSGWAPASRPSATCSTPAFASGSASTAPPRTSAATSCLEVKQALLVARGRGGPAALTAREALRLGTRGGAAVLGRDDIGSIEPGKCADLAIWRTDGLELGGADDLVAALVFSGPHRVDRLVVGGEEVVRDGRLVNADETEIAREHRRQAARLERT